MLFRSVEKNREKDQQLLGQSRLAQMGEMISMIAHQWRQPLGAISATSYELKMQLEFSEQEIEIEDELIEGFNSIEEIVHTMSTTIDDFRNFYKPDKLISEVKLEEPILKALKIIRASLTSKSIEIHETYESKRILKLYDNEVLQVILNIIKNAQDNFTEKGIKKGFIYIKTYDEETKS